MRKGNDRYIDGKKENFSICRGYFYVENPKHSIKRKSNIVGYKKNIYFCILIKTLWKLKIQKSMQSIITNNKQTKNPHLYINLIKIVEDLLLRLIR